MFAVPYFALLIFGVCGQKPFQKLGCWFDEKAAASSGFSKKALSLLNPYKNFDLYVIVLLTWMVYSHISVPDYDNYAEVYRIVGLGKLYRSLGMGWYGVMVAGNAAGLSFRLFKTLVCLTGFLVIAWNVRRFAKNPSSRMLAWGLYLIFPALLDCIQMRYLLAQCLIVTGVTFLREFSFKNLFWFCVLIGAACLMHTTSPIFFGLLVVYILNKWPKTGTALIAVVAVGLFLLIPQVGRIMESYAYLTRIRVYIQEGNPMGLPGIAVTIVMQAGLYLICRLMYTKWSGDERVKHYFRLCMNMSLAAFVIVPLCLFDTNFIRLLRFLWIFCFTAAGIWIYQAPETDKPLLLYGFPVRLYMIGLAVLANLYLISLFTFEIIPAFLS